MNNSFAGTTDDLIGLIDANGEAVFIDNTNPGLFRFSTFAVNGNSFSGSFAAYAGPGFEFPNGARTGTIAGTVAQGAYLNGIAALGGFNSIVNLSYQRELYEQPASFSIIAGDYTTSFDSTSGPGSATFNISQVGLITYTDTSGCAFSGSIMIPNPDRNAYEFSGTSFCGAAPVALTGLATFTPATASSAAQLTFEYDDGVSMAVFGTATRN